MTLSLSLTLTLTLTLTLIPVDGNGNGILPKNNIIIGDGGDSNRIQQQTQQHTSILTRMTRLSKLMWS